MISVENLTKSFAGQTLFDKTSFTVAAKERVGLVGRNGHGKTTLLRMIMDEETWDEGTIVIPKNYRLGMVRQRLSFTKDTVLEEGMLGLPASKKDHHWEIEKILAGLGFSVKDIGRHPNEFSGGFQVRLNLAKVIAAEPDLLLLDEPTNYLDIASIRWIEKFLVKWPHELMLITHDRGFMDKVVTHILGIHRQRILKIKGSTENYYAQVAQDEEVYEKTRINDERKRKEINQFISRFRAKARLANLVQSRIKTLEKMEKKERLQKISTLDFSFRYKPMKGKPVMRAERISFSYDPNMRLISELDIAVNNGDRIGVIGKNGKGKTTLLKLLAGALKPESGGIYTSPNVEIGFFEQTNARLLEDSRTVEEEVLYSAADIDRQRARDICGAMMFEGDSALKKIAVLSGGERSRVLLGKILATPVNLLILDEPSNHLDMDSCDALLAALDSYEGTVIMVTHNEMFLYALANRLVVFQDEHVSVFEGGYQYFLEKEGWHDETLDRSMSRAANEKTTTGGRLTKKEIRQKRSEIITERGKKVKPLDQKIAVVERDIERYEQKINELNNTMVGASQSNDGKIIAEISKKIYSYQSLIEERFIEFETLHKKREYIESEYNRILKDFA
jgi:ATP-binding cassette subfamily F protein 3